MARPCTLVGKREGGSRPPSLITGRPRKSWGCIGKGAEKTAARLKREPFYDTTLLRIKQFPGAFLPPPTQAIDVWMGLCTAFVFAALVEFTIVNFWFRKQRARAGVR